MKKFLLCLSLLLATATSLLAQGGVIFAVQDSFCVDLGADFIGNVTINDDNPSGNELPTFLISETQCFRLDQMGNLTFQPGAADCCGEFLLTYTYEGCEEPDLCTADIIIIVKCPKPDCALADLSDYLAGGSDGGNPDLPGGCLSSCEESTATYYVPYNSNNSYTWSVTGGTFTGGSNAAEILVDWGPAGSGTITLAVTTPAGETTTATVCVDILEGPTAAFTPASTTVCLGSDLFFENNSVDGNDWYWDFGDGTISTDYEPTHAYTTPGTYTVVLTVTKDNYGPAGEALCCCTDTVTAEIVVDPLPSPEILCISTLCAGDTSKYWTDATGCGNYNWTVLDANDNPLPFTGQGTDTICVIWPDGPFGQLILDATGCDAAYCSQPTTAIVPIISSVADLSGPAAVCENDIATYVAPKWPGVAYDWLVTGGNVLSGQGTNVIVVQWGAAPGPGTIQLNYASEFLSGLPGQDPDDCAGSASLTVAIAPIFEVSGPRLACVSSTTFYSATSSPSSAYTWTITPAATFTGQGTNFITVDWSSGPGNYTITATPNDPTVYCLDEVAIRVNVIELPPPAGIEGDTAICPGGTNTYFGMTNQVGTSFRWTVTGGTPAIYFGNPITINWNATGPYQIQLQQQGFSAPFCLSEPITLDLTEKELAGPLTISGPAGCTNSVATYTAGPGQHPDTDFNWSVSPSSAGSIISGQGTSSVMVQWNNDPVTATLSLSVDLCGDTDSEILTVNLTAAPPPTITQIGLLCPDSTAILDAGAGYSSYNWSTFANTQTISITGSGNYVVTVTDTNGCTSVGTYQAVELEGPVASISTPDNTNLCINEPASVTITALTAPGYTYDWYCNDVAQGLPSSQNFLVHNNTMMDMDFDYYVIVTDADGCSRQSNTITVNQDDCTSSGDCDPEDHTFSFVSANQTPFCNTVDFTVTSSANVTISGWNFGDPTSNVNDGTPANAIHTYPTAGCRFVSLFGSVPNQSPPPPSCAAYASGSICVPLAADFSFVVGCQDVEFCDQSTYLPGEGPTAYSWDFGDGNTSSLAKPSHTYALAGTYTVTLVVTNANGCQSMHTETVTVDGLPVPTTFAASPSPACVGQAVDFSATATDIISWLWDFGDGATNGSQNPSHTYENDGSYTVSLTLVDEFGCSNTVTLSLTVLPELPQDTIAWSPGLEVCANETIVLTAPSGSGYQYEWSTGSTTDTIHPSQSGSYGVTITDANGCILIPAEVDVLIYPLPPAFIDGPQVICDAGCITLDAPAGFGLSYQWYNNGGTLMPGQNSGSLVVCAGGLAPPYLVEVTDQNGCVALSDPFNVSLEASPAFTVDVAPDPCEGSLSTLSINPVQPDVVYSWNTGETGASIDVIQAGVYNVIGRDTTTGCSAVGSATIHPLPDLCIVPVGCYETCSPDTICGPDGLAAYQWNLDGSPIAGATEQCLIVTASGTYSLTGTTEFGCSTTSDPLMLTVLDCGGCDDISAFVTEEDTCCWALSYQNDYDGELYAVQVTMNDAVMDVNTASISPALMPTSLTDHGIILQSIGGGPLPTGLSEEFMIFCLSEVENFPQQLIIDWYDAASEVVCSDTILLDCPVEPDCMYLSEDSIYCDEGIIVYDLTLCNPIDAAYSIGFVDLQVFSPAGATLTPPSFDLSTNPIMAGECRTLTVTLNGVDDCPGDEFCFNLVAHNLPPDIDTALCCSLDTLYCVTIPDCNPCDDIGVDFVEALEDGPGDCCYSIGIYNDYEADFFDGISICVLTPGVSLTMDNPLGSDWLTTSLTPTQIDLAASPAINGHIPLGDISLPTICVASATSPTQQIELKWMMDDGVICRDTITLNCDPPCGYINREEIVCTDDGGWLYTGYLHNTSAFIMGEAHFVFTSPAGMDAYNSNLSLGALAPGDSIFFSLFLGGPAMAGDELCFTVALHELDDDDTHVNCCNFHHCITLPECEPDPQECLCDDNFFDQVGQGIDCLPVNNGIHAFAPLGNLLECDDVFWRLDNGEDDFPVQQTSGNASVSYNLTTNGDYRICILVIRNSIDGTVCEDEACKEFVVGTTNPLPVPASAIFPNPATNRVTVQAGTYWPKGTEIRMTDVHGKVVYRFNTGAQEITLRKDIPLDRLPAGVYWIRVRVADRSWVEKLVVW